MFAYVIWQRWFQVCVTGVVAMALTLLFVTEGLAVPLAFGMGVLVVAVAITLGVAFARIPVEPPGWRRDIWGPALGEYSSSLAPFNGGNIPTTMRLTTEVQTSGGSVAPLERVTVQGILPFGAGTAVQIIYLQHSMPAVEFRRRHPGNSTASDPLQAVDSDGHVHQAQYEVSGEPLLVHAWMTPRARHAMDDLVLMCHRVALSGTMLYAYGYDDADIDRVRDRLAELYDALTPGLRRSYGSEVESTEMMPAVTAVRGCPTLTWASLLGIVVLPWAGFLFALGAVAAPGWRVGARALAWVSLLGNSAMIAGSVLVMMHTSAGQWEGDTAHEDDVVDSPIVVRSYDPDALDEVIQNFDVPAPTPTVDLRTELPAPTATPAS